MTYANLLSSEECREMLTKRLGTTDFQLLSVDIGPMGESVLGFMSDHLKIRSNVLRPDGSILDVRFFAKTVPRNVQMHSDYVLSTGAYNKETTLYAKLVLDLRKVYIPEDDGNRKNTSGTHRWAPDCYFTRPDIIVLDDLSVYNFKPFNNRVVMDYKHCELVLRELASFHAASIVYEENERNSTGNVCRLFDKYPDMFIWNLGTTLVADDSKGWFQAGVRTMLSLVELLPKYRDNPDVVRVIRDKIPEACNRVLELGGVSEQFRNVTCHGDLWSNNILFRHGDDGQAEEVRFVDFQLVRYTPPASDVLLFLHVTTFRAFRNLHESTLLALYHEMLTAELRRHGLDAERLLSRAEFDASCEQLRDVGRGTAPLYYQMILLRSEIPTSIFTSPEEFNRFMLVDRSKEVCESFCNDDLYRFRMNEAMEEFIDNCILTN